MAVQAFVVRRDRKPLTKETVETMYHFHVSLKLGNSFRDKDGINHLPSSEWACLRQISEHSWRSTGQRNLRTLNRGDIGILLFAVYWVDQTKIND